jgi:microcystin-dependent protein
MLCDGRTLTVEDFQRLYNIIGNTYGGNATQFNLPNPAGRVLGVVGAGSGLTARTKGTSIGEETHTLTIPEMPTHNHSITDPGHNHSYTNQPNIVSPATSLTTTDVADNDNVAQTTGTSTTGITINNTGSSNPHNNMQPTLFVGNMFIYCGRTQVGTYPFFGNTVQ